VTETSKNTEPAAPGGRRPKPQKRLDTDAAGLTKGAAAAERASAGMGTEDAETAAWLFGDSLAEEHSG
jgi:hypothetical protein